MLLLRNSGFSIIFAVFVWRQTLEKIGSQKEEKKNQKK